MSGRSSCFSPRGWFPRGTPGAHLLMVRSATFPAREPDRCHSSEVSARFLAVVLFARRARARSSPQKSVSGREPELPELLREKGRRKKGGNESGRGIPRSQEQVGDSSLPVHLEYSCPGLSLDVVTGSPGEVISFRLYAVVRSLVRAAGCSQRRAHPPETLSFRSSASLSLLSFLFAISN